MPHMDFQGNYQSQWIPFGQQGPNSMYHPQNSWSMNQIPPMWRPSMSSQDAPGGSLSEPVGSGQQISWDPNPPPPPPLRRMDLLGIEILLMWIHLSGNYPRNK